MRKILDILFNGKKQVDTTNKVEYLYPMLRTDKKSQEIEAVLITKPWIADVEFVYKFDSNEYYSYLIESNSQNFGSIDEIHEVAVNNLRKNIKYEIKKTIFNGYGLLCGTVYEASFIAVPEIWEKYSNELDDDLIVGISNRDILMFVPISEYRLVVKLKEAIEGLYIKCDFEISNKLFRYWRNEKKWSVYQI